MTERQQAGFFGLSDCRFALPGQTPIPMRFAQNLALNPKLSTTKLQADNVTIIEVPSDQGFEGTLGLSNECMEYAKAMGYVLVLEDGAIAYVDVVQLPKHFIYYENLGVYDDGTTFVMKNWLMGVTTAKSGKNYTTKGDSPEFGKHEMPLVVYGEPLKKSSGDVYIDENGFTRLAQRIVAIPGNPGYETFEQQIPEAKVADTQTEPGGEEGK